MGLLEPTYLVVKSKRDGEVDFWIVSKFEGKPQPIAVYNVMVDEKPIACDCGSFSRSKRDCKHMEMVKVKIDKGEIDSCKEILGKSFEDSFSELMAQVGIECKPEDLKSIKVDSSQREVLDYVIKDRLIEDLIE